jgi:nitrogen regulatory protein PII
MTEHTLERPTAPNGDESELWMIVAVIRPFKLDAVTMALENVTGFAGMTVTTCRGFGRGRPGVADSHADPAARRRETDSGLTTFSERLKLEVAVAGRRSSHLVADTIVQAAHTGNRGDGKVFVWPFAHAVRIRTAETDSAAIGGHDE